MTISASIQAAVSERNWNALNTSGDEDYSQLSNRTSDFTMSRHSEIFRKVMAVVSVLFFPITLLTISRKFVSRATLQLFYPSVGRDLPLFRKHILSGLRVEGSIVRHVCIVNNGNKYSGILVGKKEHFESGQWVIHGTGNNELAEETIEDLSQKAHEVGFGALIMNAPLSGASQGAVSPECMGEAHDAGLTFLETALKANKILLSGRSMGGAAMSQAILQHTFKKDVRYSVIREVTFSSLSAMAQAKADLIHDMLKEKSFFSKVVCTAAKISLTALIHILGLNLNQSKASDKLHKLGIRDVIVQKGSNFPYDRFSPVIEDDGVIPVCASLAWGEQVRGLNRNQKIKLRPGYHNNLDVYQPIGEELRRLQ